MRFPSIKSRLPVSLAALVLVIAGCAPAASAPVVQTRIVESTRVIEQTVVVEKVITATPPPRSVPDTFIFGAESEPVCLDPALAFDDYSPRVVNQVFEGLVKFDKDTTNVVPGLAEKWTVSEDGKSWVFSLRKGIKFHDGTDLNADSIVKNWDYWRNTRNPVHAAQVKAGQSFEYYAAQFMGFDDDSLISSVQSVDATTVKFTLRMPQGKFLNNLAMFAFGISSPSALEKAGLNSCKNPIGTGPYKFVEWKPNEQVILQAFPDYWDKANAPKMNRVIVRTIPNISARLLALSAGEIHAMEGLEPRDIAAVKDNKNLKLLLRPSNTTGFIAFNFKVKEFQDPKVRQAFAQAINKTAIVDRLFGGTGLVAKEFQPPSMWGYNKDLDDWKYDSSAARKLLADAGYPNGVSDVTFDGKKIPLELWYVPIARPYFPSPKETASAIATDWAKAGINVSLQTTDWVLYREKRKNGQMPLYLLGWMGDNGDPDNYLCYFFCLDPRDAPKTSEGYLADKEVSDLLKKAAAMTKQEDRAKAYQQAEKLIHDKILRIFVAHNQPVLAFSANVEGYVASPVNAEYFNTVVVK